MNIVCEKGEAIEIIIDEERVKNVDQFKYLGRVLKKVENSCEK